MRSRFGCVPVMALLASYGLLPLWGQGDAVTASLSGTVYDAQNAAVPQAKVTLSDPKSAFSRDTTTGRDGSYVLTLIPPGRYQLQVTKEGFSTYLQEGVILSIAQSSSLDPVLQVGQIGLVVEVTADSPVLNTGNANIGSEVSSEQVVDLPLNIRNVYNLVQLSSSVNNSTEVQGLT